MTKRTLYSKLKPFIAILLIAILSVCVCGFFVACGESESSESSSATNYSYSETDTDTISNANFAYGTYNKTSANFPLTSPTGWTRSTDDSSVASNVNSGVVSTAAEDWDKLFDTLYSDSDFSAYFTYKFKDKATEAIRTDKGDSNYSPSASELKIQYKNYFVNPSTPVGAEDAYVYMLNNYVTDNYNFNSTAQRVRSSSTVTVKKGEIYKISLSVKTLNVTGNGANIRIANTVNGSSQAEYRISGIKDTEWTTYTVYFKANAEYDCSFIVSFGLGYGSGDANAIEYYSEGTAFFDGVKAEKVDAIPATGIDATDKLDFMSNEVIEKTVSGTNSGKTFVYDMNYELTAQFAGVDLSASLSAALTSSNIDGTPIGNGNFNLQKTADSATLTLNAYSGVTLTLKNGNENFKVASGKYTILTFKLQNKLDKLSSTDITVDVFDVLGDTEEKRAAVATFSNVTEDDEFINGSIVVKNNFADVDREFYVQIVVGPADIASIKAASDLAKGSVAIKNVQTAQGFNSVDEYEDGSDNKEYKILNSFSSAANATVALYAGFNADASEESSSSVSYSLTPAKGAIGTIVTGLADVAGYNGIVANHIYVTGVEGSTKLETAVNTRSQFDGADGYAGLINTAYMENYADKANLKALLKDLYDQDNAIQPIVIFNNSAENLANHYGYVGESKSLSASDYAKVTVKLKVQNAAKAYIYLVDVSGAEKEVMTFADFTVGGKKYTAEDRKFVITVDATAPVGADGWTEVNFYVASGATARTFRVEVWNGGRDGLNETASKGYVAINEIAVNTSSAFSEPKMEDAASTDNPIYNMFDSPNKLGAQDELISYTRELTETEKAFNKEYPKDAVSYNEKYIWAKSATAIYAIFNTVDPVEEDPYKNITEEESESGCASETDASTFWMSFSSILLAAVIVLALIALVVKNIVKKHNANKSDVKAQYKVKSRTETHKAIRKAQEKKNEQADDDEETEETEDGETDEATETTETEEVKAEETAQEADAADADGEENAEDKTTIETDYVYGDVQDFGDMTLETEDKPKDEEK